MKKTILILLVTVFCGFQLAEAQTVEATTPAKTEVKADADADQPVKLSKTDRKSMKKKGCCASKMGAKQCSKSKSASATTVSNGKYDAKCADKKFAKKNCTPEEKAACEKSKVKMASKVVNTEGEVKTSVQ